jgi:hypothetical protein
MKGMMLAYLSKHRVVTYALYTLTFFPKRRLEQTMIAPRLPNSMLHDGRIVIVHSDNVTLVDLVGLLKFPLDSWSLEL